jgi:hypothetical protein
VRELDEPVGRESDLHEVLESPHELRDKGGMAHRLSPESLRAGIAHLSRYGDTDIFPHLPEVSFFADEREAIVAELAKLDLDTYTPAGAVEALAPKGRYSFRIAHQLPALDTLLLLACVIEIGDKIEAKRQSGSGARAFSYRFAVDSGTGQVFRPDRTYKDWLHRQQSLITKDKKIRRIIMTDISDYYARINFHRLENLLDEAAPAHGAVRFIKNHIKVIRAKQSFGLPVGGSAARLLAELALIDTDQALKDRGLLATRFVDDFRIFLTASDNTYDALGFLAEQLGITEGLSLNSAKTTVISRRDYVNTLDIMTTDLEEEAEGVALDTITTHLYFDEEPDEEDLKKLKGLNLVGMLETEIEEKNWDFGRIRILFRALKIVKPIPAIELIKERFEDLLVFGRELCLLMEALENESSGCFQEMLDEIIDSALMAPASSVQLIRTWLLEILVRGIVDIPLIELKRLEGLPAMTDRRQLLLIRGRCRDRVYFRKQKTAISSFSEAEMPCLVWGASCLPKNEFIIWLETAKLSFGKPLGALFLKWIAQNQTKLVYKLKSTVVDDPE